MYDSQPTNIVEQILVFAFEFTGVAPGLMITFFCGSKTLDSTALWHLTFECWLFGGPDCLEEHFNAFHSFTDKSKYLVN